MLHTFFPSFLQGLGLGAGLIIAIGAQNAFVLRQGLKKQYTFVIASICTLCDAALILLGVSGLGSFITAFPSLLQFITWGGALFLGWYGLRSFRSALAPAVLKADETLAQPARLKNVVLTTLALSLLNPHVYLDTVLLVGSVGAHYPGGERVTFALGAMSASLLWFFSLAYGAGWLGPLFQKRAAWRILDGLIGCVMWAIAASLIWSALQQAGFMHTA